MRSATLTRRDKAPISDIRLRLDVLEQRGQYFRNPVTVFTAVNGPGNLGVKVSFQVYLTLGIDSVEILRNTARDAASAAVLQTYAISQLTANKPIVYYDHDKAIVGKTAYYWIRVIPKPSKFTPIIQGPQLVSVPKNGDSTLLPPNDPSNTTNFATVDSIDAGTSATARIYGTGGVGTSWMRRNGFGGADPSYPAGTITGLAYSTAYYVIWNGTSYQAFTSFANGLPDNYIFAGKVTTVASGGGGGSSGGGGAGGGGGGCCEIGTRLEIPPASRIFVRKEDCGDWVELETEDGYFVAVARNTLVSTFVRAQNLQPGTLLETLNGGLTKLERVEEKKRKSVKLVARVLPGQVYFGGGLRLHNFKLL